MPALITRPATARRFLIALAVLATATVHLPATAAAASPFAPAVFTQNGAFTPAALHVGVEATPVLQPAVDLEPSHEPATAPVGAGWG
jgi:hypothetical protein